MEKENPRQASLLLRLNREIKKLNNELGLKGKNKFEADHIKSIIDSYYNTGVVDFSIDNIQIVPSFVNSGGVMRKGKKLVEAPDARSKAVLFESSKTGIRRLYTQLKNTKSQKEKTKS